MRRKCYGLPVRLPCIVVTCARMFGIKRVCCDPPCRLGVFLDILSVHDTINTNLRINNFLVVAILNLLDGTYYPYRKPNNETLYIDSNSNIQTNIERVSEPRQ